MILAEAVTIAILKNASFHSWKNCLPCVWKHTNWYITRVCMLSSKKDMHKRKFSISMAAILDFINFTCQGHTRPGGPAAAPFWTRLNRVAIL